jgi:hypothetical protein
MPMHTQCALALMTTCQFVSSCFLSAVVVLFSLLLYLHAVDTVQSSMEAQANCEHRHIDVHV